MAQPTIAWPHGKRCAFTISFDLDGESPWIHRDPALAERPLHMSMGAYGPRTGAPRILDALDRYGIKAGWFIPAWIVERYPDLCPGGGETAEGARGGRYIRPDETDKIKQLAEYMKENDGIVARLEGHTDPRGSDPYNVRLSERRVEAVRKALIDAGVTAERVSVGAFGKRQPTCSTQDESCMQADRRVEVYFGTDEGTAAASPRGSR